MYYAFDFKCSGNEAEIIIALLSDIDFDGFEQDDSGLIAWSSRENKINDSVAALIRNMGIEIPCARIVAPKNWNTEWEKKIEPVIVNNTVIVRTEFHKTEKNYPFEIIIQPKMSFGTGHHATTLMMMEMMLEQRNKFLNASVFDFGSGTGILSIFAEKLGANNVTALDNEVFAFENMKENFERNQCTRCFPILGEQVPDESNAFDLILANITRNVITANLFRLIQTLRPLGNILCSGILESDENVIMQSAEKLHLMPLELKKRNGWLALNFQKTK